MPSDALIGMRIIILGAAEARKDISAVQGDLGKFTHAINVLGANSASIGQKLVALGTSITSVGKSLTFSLTTPLLAAGGSLLAFGIQFEDAFAGIAKTIEGVANVANDGSVSLTAFGEGLRDAIRDMAQEIPIAATELAHIGEVAGQLGVRGRDNLLAFIETIAKMGVATNLSTEDAAFGLARLNNIMGSVGTEAVDMADFVRRAASTIVDLGNNASATESEILNLGLRLASAGRQAGLTTPEVLGLAASLAEIGVRAELGGTALSRVIQEMIFAISDGGEALQTFADISGTTTEEFAENFRANPIQAIKDFIAALEEAQSSGMPGMKDALLEIGLSGVRVRDVLGRLGGDMSILDENIERANKAWAEQNALQEEAAKRFGTVKSQLGIVKNRFIELGIVLFDRVREPLLKVIDSFGEFLDTIGNIDPALLDVVLAVAALAAAVGPVLVVAGLLTTFIGSLASGLGLLIVPLALAAAGVGLLIKQLVGVSRADGVLEFFKLVVQEILDFANNVSHGIDPLFALTIALHGIFNTETAGRILDVVKSVQEIVSLFGGLASGSLSFSVLLPPELDDTATIIDDMAQTLRDLLSGNISIADLVPESVKTDLATVLKSIELIQTKAAETKFPGADVAATEGLELFDESVVAGLPIIQDVLDTISGIIATIAEQSAPVIALFAGMASDDLNSALENLGIAFDNLGLAVGESGNAWEAFKPILETLIPALIAIAITAIGVVVIAFTSFIEALSEGAKIGAFSIKFLIQAVEGLFTSIRGIADFAIGLALVIATPFIVLVELLSGSTLQEALNTVATTMQSAWNHISQGVQEFVSGIVKLIFGLALSIAAGFGALVVIVISLIANFVTNVIDVFQGLYDVLVGNSIIPDLIAAIINEFISLPIGVMGAVSDLISQVTEAISGLKTTAINLFGSLKDGLIAKAQEIASEVGNVLSELLGGLGGGTEGGGVSIPLDTKSIADLQAAFEGLQSTLTTTNALFTLFTQTATLQFATFAVSVQAGLAVLLANAILTFTTLLVSWQTTALTFTATTTAMLLQGQLDFATYSAFIIGLLPVISNSFMMLAADFTTAGEQIREDMALTIAAALTMAVEVDKAAFMMILSVNSMTWAWDSLAAAARNAQAAACAAAENIAACTNEAADATLASPDLRITHGFERLEDYLKTTDIPKLITSSLAPAVNLMGMVSVSPVAGGGTTIDNSMSFSNISGVPMDEGKDFSEFLVDSARRARSVRR